VYPLTNPCGSTAENRSRIPNSFSNSQPKSLTMSEPGPTTVKLSAALMLLAGNHQDARERLLTHSHKRLERFARQALRQFPAVATQEQTNDVLQELYTRLLKGWDSVFADQGQPLTDPAVFFRRSARLLREVLLDLKRRHTGRDGQRPRCGSLADQDPLAPASHDQHEIHELMNHLSSDDLRAVADLHFYQGFTLIETAGILGIGEATARRKWVEARLELSVLLDAPPHRVAGWT
jgi:DNA-directed RNA polymerase specialized sigma24 family protein